MTGSASVRKLDEDLHHLKRVLSQCSVMLDCKSCSRQSSVMMLILSICEKMLASVEQLCNTFLGPSSPHSRRPSSSDSLMSTITLSSLNGDDTGGLRIGDYTLDTEDEVHVVRVLIISRMKNLGNLLARLDKIISSNGWTGHGEILENIHVNYRKTVATIKRLEL